MLGMVQKKTVSNHLKCVNFMGWYCLVRKDVGWPPIKDANHMLIYLQTEEEEMLVEVENEMVLSLLYHCHLYCVSMGLLFLPFGA